MARPTKLTPEVQERICKAIRLGATYEMAAQYGGVSVDTFHQWTVKGETGRQPYAGFLGALKEAESEGLVGWLDKIEAAAANGEWQAAAWKAERRYPHTYGRRVQDVIVRTSDEDLRRIALRDGKDPERFVALYHELHGDK